MTVHLSIEGHWDLELSDAFPDGIPDPCTFADILEAVRRPGDIGSLLDEWCMEGELELFVRWERANPEAGQIDLFTGVPVPDVLRDDVWLNDRLQVRR